MRETPDYRVRRGLPLDGLEPIVPMPPIPPVAPRDPAWRGRNEDGDTYEPRRVPVAMVPDAAASPDKPVVPSLLAVAAMLAFAAGLLVGLWIGGAH